MDDQTAAAGLVTLARTALGVWDAWCPDDGRPAAAVAMIERVLAGPVPDAEYEAVYDAVLASCEMAGGLPAQHAAGHAVNGIGLVLWAVREPDARGLPFWARRSFNDMTEIVLDAQP